MIGVRGRTAHETLIASGMPGPAGSGGLSSTLSLLA
jgi:hypothetical protein